MSNVEHTFVQLQENNRTALMPFLTMGYPERDSVLELVPAIVEAGADMVELGVPFSDPLAEGTTIQASSQRALENGMTLDLCLEQAAALRAKGITVPFLLMGYYNPIYQMGIEQFAKRSATAGIDGLIIPDLPPEESDPLQSSLREHGIDIVFLLAPTSNVERLQIVAARSSGFIYLVSLIGVTGARDEMRADLQAFVDRVRSVSDLPLAVGFGISTPEQAAHVAEMADGVIVGSALIDAIRASSEPAHAAHEFVASLRAGIDSVTRLRTSEAQR